MTRRFVTVFLAVAAASIFGGCTQSNPTDAAYSVGPVRPARPVDAPRPVFDPNVKGVNVWEEQVIVPTYVMGPAEPNPQFYLGGQSQGAQQRVYPYPAYDITTTEKVNKTYKMVYLENQYIKIGVMPELGGKMFEAVDKTNGYAFIYNQHVVKPALISLLGAWISGGVEWDLPHHHRATSLEPIQYTIEQSPDGSKTCWVGELELRDQMLWTVGLTLHPGKNYVEASFRMVNRTPVPTSMLCFSNVGVHSSPQYQVIFPPDTQYWTYHKKDRFEPWTDALSRLSNHAAGGSWFAWNYSDDFMAGYDHGKQAGTMSIADHNVVPGKKFFTFGGAGTNDTQAFARLSDNDGPYLELMVGAYSDNQPDYTWMTPFETRSWTQYWYPFRDIDGVKCANTEAAVNLDVADGKIKVGFYSTSDRPAASVLLKLKDQTLLQEQIAINPGKAYVKEIALPAGADEHDLRASLSDGGKELVAYSPVRLTPEVRPTPVAPNYPAPADVKSNEELYLIGLRIEQFHTPYDPENPGTTNSNAMPETYWNEALRRDPGDVRVNTVMGIDAVKGGRYADAEKYLRKALERATDRFTTPKDGEPYYYLGLALKGQGKLDDAFNQFAKSVWMGAWRGPGYFEMAEIATTRGDENAALTYANDSLNSGAESVRALALKSALLRHAGQTTEALACSEAIRKIDPLDVHGLAERWLAAKTPQNAAALAVQLNELPATGLEVAGDFLNAGLWEDGTEFLTQVVNASADQSKVSPLVYYDLAYFAQKLNQPEKAASYSQLAVKASPEYVFPFQMEMIPVLEAAIAANPADARAPYYLGNLLFDWQPAQAKTLWEKSVALGADFPVVYRNLAQVYTREGGQRDKVQSLLEKGVQYGGNAKIFDQLDQLYEENGVAPEKRLALLEAHQAMLNRPEVISREINLAVFCGKPDLGVKLITSLYFRAWEGGSSFNMGDEWANANLVAGQQRLAAKQYKDALAFYQAALVLPPTLAEEGGGNPGTHAIEANYYMGLAYEGLGDMASARQAWTKASAGNMAEGAGPGGFGGRGGRGGGGGGGGGRAGGIGAASGVRVAAADAYFQALAAQKLGDTARATTLFNQLVTTGTQAASRNAIPANTDMLLANDRSAIADAHYLIALGNLGLGNKDQARQELTIALKVSPDHLAAKEALESIGQ